MQCAYIIADNKLSLNAGWDEDLLAVEISDLKGEAFDISLLGFDDGELEKLFRNATEANVKEDDFDIDAELEKPAMTCEGDLWTIGRHRLLCGDTTIAENLDRLMKGEKANLTVTDPPYNVDYKGVAGTIRNDNMGNEEFYAFLLAAFNRMHENMAPDASIYVFHADTEGLNFRKAFDEAGFHLSGCCIWKKSRLMMGHSPYQWQHEPCLFGWLKGGKHCWYSDRKQTTIWEFDKPSRNELHPTMKPVALISYCMVRMCPGLRQRVKILASTKRIVYSGLCNERLRYIYDLQNHILGNSYPLMAQHFPDIADSIPAIIESGSLVIGADNLYPLAKERGYFGETEDA